MARQTILLLFILGSTAFAAAKSPKVIRAIASEQEPSTSGKIWVAKADNATSCNTVKAIAIEAHARELAKHSVKQFAQKKWSDGKMRIEMCGAAKGTKNAFLIDEKDKEKAKAAGFDLLPNE